MYTDVRKPNQDTHIVAKFHILEKKIEYLEKKLISLEAQLTATKIPQPAAKQTGTIKKVVYVKEYTFKGENWQQFFVTLEEVNDTYRHDKRKGEFDKDPLVPGDTIYFEIDNDKLRKVVKVHPIN